MKAEYNSLIYAYESNSADILSIIADDFDIATEAESQPTELDPSKAVSDTVKSDESKAASKTLWLNKVIEKVKALIKKMLDMFESLKRKLTNRFRLLGETDQGFFNLYYKRKSMVKPYKNVKVISYAYNNQILDKRIEKMMIEVTKCFDKLRAVKGTTNSDDRISEIINAPQGKVIEVLLSPYIDNGDAQITSMEQFIKYIVSKYRGDKKEIVYNDTQLPQIEANALSTKDIATRCNDLLRTAQLAYNNLKMLEHQIKRDSDNEEVTKLVMSNLSKATTLYNAYSALVSAYYELKLEQSLNYRIILKKFYQF